MGRKRKHRLRPRRTNYSTGYSNRNEYSNDHWTTNDNWYDRQAYLQHYLNELNERKERNKQLFAKATSAVSSQFPGLKILSYFGGIKFEILHLIPCCPDLAPELLLLRAMEQHSVLLGRIDRCDEIGRKVFIKDVEDGEICFDLNSISLLAARPGRFIAIHNPGLIILPDGQFAFCAKEEGRVVFIDVDVDNKYDMIVIVFIITVIIAIVAYFVFGKKH